MAQLNSHYQFVDGKIHNSRHVGLLLKKGDSRWAGIILSAALALCLSCSDNDSDAADLEANEETVELQFTLRLSDSAATKSTYSESEGTETGTDYENTISSIQVFLYATAEIDGTSTADVCVGSLTQFSFLDSGSGTYVYHGSVNTSALTSSSDGSYSFSGKIMVLANCSTYSPTIGSTTLSDTNLSALTYTASSDNGGVLSSGIPMWGVLTVSNLSLRSGSCTVLSESIDLLRAMAKIVISLATDDENDSSDAYDDVYGSTADDYVITAASLDVYNSSGYCIPSGYSSATNTKGLETDCKSIPSAVSTSSSLSFIGEDGSYVAYVPEYAGSSTIPKVTVSITKSSTQKSSTEAISLAEYSDGSTSATSGIDIVRNHIYTYTLSKTYDSDLNVTCTVDAWTDETSSVSWDNQDITVYMLPNPSTESNMAGKLSDSGDEEARYCVVTYPRWSAKGYLDSGSDESGKYYEPTKSLATFRLYVKSSVGRITWKAYLTNPSYFYFSSTKSDIDSETRYSACIGVSRDEPYSLKIGPYGTDENSMWDDVYSSNSITAYSSSDIAMNGIKYLKSDDSNKDFLIYAADEHKSEGESEVYVYQQKTTETTTYATYDTSSSPYKRYQYTVGSTDSQRDTIVAVYTDLFILVEGAPVPTALTINPVNNSKYTYNDTEYAYSGMFKTRSFAGGTYEQTVYVDLDDDGEMDDAVTLAEGQWIRMFWACAMAETDASGVQTYSSKDIWSKLMSVDDDGNPKYMPESDHWFSTN